VEEKAKEPIKLIINPNSKPLRVRIFLSSMLRILEEGGYEADIYWTRGSEDTTAVAQEAAASGRYRVIVAGGGDGTANEVINGVVGHPVTLGLLPLGTSNVLMRELGIPLDPLKAARLIVKGHRKRFDLGRVNNRYFALMVSCGYDAYSIEKTSLWIKRIAGKYAYILAGFVHYCQYRPRLIRVTLDGASMEGTFVVISNARLYGGNYQLTPEARMDDGLFDVFIYKGRSKGRFFYFGLRVMAKRSGHFADVGYYRARKVHLESDERVPCQADGDLIGDLPRDVEIVPKAIEIICP